MSKTCSVELFLYTYYVLSDVVFPDEIGQQSMDDVPMASAVADSTQDER